MVQACSFLLHRSDYSSGWLPFPPSTVLVSHHVAQLLSYPLYHPLLHLFLSHFLSPLHWLLNTFLYGSSPSLSGRVWSETHGASPITWPLSPPPVPSPCPRLQRWGDGGGPRPAAGFPWDSVRVVSHVSPGRTGQQRGVLRHWGRSGAPWGHTAQWRAGGSQTVGTCGHHSTGYPQHRLWEVRHYSVWLWVIITHWEVVVQVPVTNE